MSKRSKLSKIISLFAVMGFGATAAHAADSVWSGASDSDFGNAGNWSAGVPGAPDKATFDNTAALFGVDLTSGPFTINNLEFAGPATSGFTLSNGTLTTTSINQLASFSGDRQNRINSQVISSGASSISSGELYIANTASGSANDFTGATIAVNAGGTLRAIGGGGSQANSIANATINLNGGTFIGDYGTTVVAPGFLTHEYTQYSVGGRTLYGPGASATVADGILGFNDYEQLISLRDRMPAPSDQGFFSDALDYPAGGGFTTLDSNGAQPFTNAFNLTGTDNIVAGFFGLLNITTPGAYTFQTASDDGTVVYIDGVKVVDNNRFQGIGASLITNTINLSSGEHKIAIAYFEKGGDAGMVAGWSGPDTGDVMTVIDPSANPGSFSAVVPDGGDNFTSNAVSVTGGTPSTLISAADSTVDYGPLSIAAGSQLNTNGGKALFNGTTITGTATINNTTGVDTGVLSKSGGAVTLVKTGVGTLELTDTSGASNLTAGDTIQLNGGTTKVIKDGVNSTIGGAAINLAGGTLVFENTSAIVGGSLQARFYNRANFTEGDAQWANEAEGMRFNDTRIADVRRNADGSTNFGPVYNGDGAISTFFYGADTGDFGVMYTGYFTTSVNSGTGLSHYFGNIDGDDINGVWIDVNNNGTFEPSELIDGDTCCDQDDLNQVLLDAGTYKIALTTNDTGGGGSYHFQFQNDHEFGAVETINPGAFPAQFGQRGVMNLTSTPLTVSGPGSVVSVEGAGANFGALTLQNTGELTVDTASTTFSAISVSGTARLNTIGTVTPPLSGITAGSPATLIKGGGGVLDLSNNAMTPLSSNITLNLNDGVTRASFTTLGSSSLLFTGGRLELSIVGATGNVANALRSDLYRSTSDVIDDGSGAGIENLLANGVAANSRNLRGTADFTDGAGNCCSGDADVDGHHGIATGDVYTQVLSGKFNVTAADVSNNIDFTFGTFDGDDQMAVWIDLDQSGVFGDSLGEMVVSAGCCNNDVQATINQSLFINGAGAYDIALATRDTGGGGSQRFLFGTTGNPLETIQPNKPSQAGRFSTPNGYTDTVNIGVTSTYGSGNQRVLGGVNGNFDAVNVTGTVNLQDGARLLNNLPTTYSNVAVQSGTGTLIGEDPTVANETTVVNASIPGGATLAFESVFNVNEVNPNQYSITGTVAGTGTIRSSGTDGANGARVQLTNNGVMFSGASNVSVPQNSTISFNPGTGNTGTGATMTGGNVQGTISFSSGTTNLPSAVFNQNIAPTIEDGVLIEAGLNGGFVDNFTISGSRRKSSMVYMNIWDGNGGTTTNLDDLNWRDNLNVGYKGQIFIPDNTGVRLDENFNVINASTSDGLGSIAFGENFDDDVSIRLGGTQRYRNTQWDDNGSTGEIILPVGWIDIEVIGHEGGGGAGPSDNAGWDRDLAGDIAKGFGIDLNPDDGFDDLTFNGDDPFQNGNNSGFQSQYVMPSDGIFSGSYEIQFRVVTDPSNLGVVNVENGAVGNVNAVTNMWNVNLSGAGTLGTTGASSTRATNANGTGGTVNNAGSYATAQLNVAAGASFTKSGAGTLNIGAQTLGNGTFVGSYNLGNGASANFNGGTTNITINGGDNRSIGTGTTVNIGSGATLNVAGSQTVLSAGGNKSKVVNSGTLNVNHNDTAGHISGPGAGQGTAAGNVNIASTRTLTSDGLRAAKLNLAAGTGSTFTRHNAAVVDGGAGGLVVLNNTAADTTGLVMGNSSLLDLNDNDLVLYYNDSVNDPNPLATVTGYIDNYYSFGLDPSAAVPIIGSTAVDNSGGARVIVAVDNLNSQFGDVGNPFYDLTLGDSGLGSGFQQVIVRFTYPGDYNLDGQVDGSDYVVVDSNLGSVTPGLSGGWTLGDGDFDGVVTTGDYGPIDTFFGSGVGSPLGEPVLNAIPEPSTWVLGSLAAIGLGVMGLRRRQK